MDVSTEIEKSKNISSNFRSDFKIKNLAMAIKAAKLCGLKERLIYKKINKIKDVHGRLELVREFKNNIKVFIDYAHTPDALLKTLRSLKFNYRSNITLVFWMRGRKR